MAGYTDDQTFQHHNHTSLFVGYSSQPDTGEGKHGHSSVRSNLKVTTNKGVITFIFFNK